RAIAVALGAAGAPVAVFDLLPDGGKDTAQAIEAKGGRAFYVSGDVSRWGDVDGAVAAAVGRLGPLAIMVNAAGILDGYARADELTPAVFERVVAINLTGTFHGCKRALAEMAPRGAGRIVNIASVAGLIGDGGGPAYVASKHGVVGLTRVLAATHVGQVELDNIGSHGTPADARRYDNERLSAPFFVARDVAQLMDELGFYALWTAEHHFQREGYECFPNLIQLSLWLATLTRRLKLGCAFNVVPMWHPIRLAEDYAMADIVTDGRVIMGVGRGYHSREVETFDAPVIDQAANRELFEEQIDLLLKCFNEE